MHLKILHMDFESDRFFSHCRLTMQPPKSYSVVGQCSSQAAYRQPAGTRPDYRGRWCAIRSHSYLRAVSEVSINRSLDRLDPAGLLTSPKFRSRNESYMRAMSTISQVSEVEVNGQFESVCESVFSEMESQAVDALDLPMPGCFRMRSHSYVRAIEKGCSQDDECVSLRTASPPRTTTTVRTIQSSTGESLIAFLLLSLESHKTQARVSLLRLSMHNLLKADIVKA
ncbi:UNVERIFIED_CONTAM: hypothetical protein FKN15_069626 [Acipenser sinensis]